MDTDTQSNLGGSKYGENESIWISKRNR
jgi:hypothetical protein